VDGRSRVEAALAGDVADRPPVGAWGHTFDEEWSPERLAAITVERAATFGWDFVKFQPRATCFSEAFGARWRASGGPSQPVLVEPAVRAIEDWERVAQVDGRPLDDQVQALRLAVDRLGDRVPVLQTVFSPLTVAGFLVGRDPARVVRELRERPDAVLPVLRRIGDALIDFSARSVEVGAAGIFYAISGYATPEVVPRDVYEELVLPTDEHVLGALPDGAWWNVLHLCGPRIDVGLAERLPARTLSWSIHAEGNPGLAAARDRTGCAVLGGVDERSTLVEGPAAEIRRQVEAAVRDTGGRGLLIGPGCSVPPEAPDANLRALAA
jgi:uroporphyrinogen decarboxylase